MSLYYPAYRRTAFKSACSHAPLNRQKCGLDRHEQIGNSHDRQNFDQGNTNEICHKLVNTGRKKTEPYEVCKFCILTCITGKPKSHQFTCRHSAYMLDKRVHT